MPNRLPKFTGYASDKVRMLVADTPPDLAPYLSGYYCTRVIADGVIEDWMPPEEANIRTGVADHYRAAIGPGALKTIPPVILSGPTDKGTHIQVSAGDFWGVGLTPAGWARFIGIPASEFANRNDDLANYPDLQPIFEAFDRIVTDTPDDTAVIKRLNATFRALLGDRLPHENAIHAVHHAIARRKPMASAELASMAGMNLRTLERFCKRHFGFPHGKLQRRQRFLRSLGRYMLDPSMRWINSLDPYYSDQAHFIREFKAVMGMNPGEYAARPHPIVGAAVSVTKSAAGVAMQALHTPRRNGDE